MGAWNLDCIAVPVGVSAGRMMKAKLQYAYSIAVFTGALITAYSMMSREGSGRLPLASMENPSLRSEASILDPAVRQLLETENALAIGVQSNSPEMVLVPKTRLPMSQKKTAAIRK